MSRIEQVQSDVRGFLQALGARATLEDSGALSVGHGSARCFINVWSPRPDDENVAAIIQLSILLLSDITESPDVYQYIAFHADDYIFGHLSLGRDDFGKVNIYMTHHFLGGAVTQEGFSRALLSMLSTATDLDDQLQAEFGGSVFHS